MLQFMAQNPWRTPNWRWLRATGIEDHGYPATTPRRDTEDGYKWIRRALRFHRLRDSDNDQHQARLALEFPDIFWAHWAWENNEQPLKHSIEAHILARETNKEIGFKLGCGPEVVEAYEKIFFNVREKLSHREYIINVVLAESVTRGLSDRHYDLLWKMFGFSGGPHVLDAMIDRIGVSSWCARKDGVPKFFNDAALNIMKKKAAIASLTVPINTNTHLHLIEAFVKYVEIERTTDSMGQAQDQIVANLDAMLKILPFDQATKRGADRKMLPRFDRLSIELNANEMMVVGAGLNLPDANTLEELAFPPPPDRRIALGTSETKHDDGNDQGSGGENPPRQRRGGRARKRRAEPERSDHEGGE